MVANAPIPSATVVLCAWCRQNGRPHGAAREPHTRSWHSVPLDYVRAQEAAGVASHGICPACLPLLVKECEVLSLPKPLAF